VIHNNFIEIQGHRGARGLFPENTLTSFLEAIKIGVKVIELDVVISKDQKIVVSHEPFMNPIFCSTPDGSFVNSQSEKEFNLFQMDYYEIAKFDCGSRGNYLFPNQIKIKEHKPLLADVVKLIETYTIENNLPAVTYNVEIKSLPEGDDIFHPKPELFVKLVCKEINSLNISGRFILQSFDVRILKELKKTNPNFPISYLVENTNSLTENLQLLGFTPDIYAPEFILITESMITELKKKQIRLITWTVNEIEDMKRLISMGVTTLITDYPDRAINLIKQTL